MPIYSIEYGYGFIDEEKGEFIPCETVETDYFCSQKCYYGALTIENQNCKEIFENKNGNKYLIHRYPNDSPYEIGYTEIDRGKVYSLSDSEYSTICWECGLIIKKGNWDK